jgi:hypothetical protein
LMTVRPTSSHQLDLVSSREMTLALFVPVAAQKKQGNDRNH